MEVVIFVGIQAVGKSTFYKERFFRTHIRINLDMLKTRHREMILVKACLEAKQAFVVDNTNFTTEQRAVYIQLARKTGFRVVGYYFQSRPADAIQRNAQRPPNERVPDKAIYGTAAKLQFPTLAEGFHVLHSVKIASDSAFVVEDWHDQHD